MAATAALLLVLQNVLKHFREGNYALWFSFHHCLNETGIFYEPGESGRQEECLIPELLKAWSLDLQQHLLQIQFTQYWLHIYYKIALDHLLYARLCAGHGR